GTRRCRGDDEHLVTRGKDELTNARRWSPPLDTPLQFAYRSGCGNRKREASADHDQPSGWIDSGGIVAVEKRIRQRTVRALGVSDLRFRAPCSPILDEHDLPVADADRESVAATRFEPDAATEGSGFLRDRSSVGAQRRDPELLGCRVLPV